MKLTNLPEAELRSWRLRQPSAKLKRKIFTDTPRIEFAWAFRLMAPAAACLMLAMAVSHEGNFSAGAAHYDPLMAMSSSNLIYLAHPQENERNDFSRLTFEWTNRSGSTSSINSFSPGRVN